MFLTRPESDATLEEFYARVRPGGPGWGRIRPAGDPSAQPLGLSLGRAAFGALLLFGAMFSLGMGLLHEWKAAAAWLIVGLIGGGCLAIARRRAIEVRT